MPTGISKRAIGSRGESGQASNFTDIETVVGLLNKSLGTEGFTFDFDANIQLEGGFKRVYIGKDTGIEKTAFLDLRVGPESPGGPTIEMASSKPGTYGIPGFTRLLGTTNKDISSTVDTFGDFLRSSFSKAKEEKKPVQKMFWSVYQEGDQEAEQSYNIPAGGTVVTPSSSSGKRNLEARRVRYVIPEGYSAKPEEGKKAFVEDVNANIESGELSDLAGYKPELNKWTSFVPGVGFTYQGMSESGVPETHVTTVRGLKSEHKSATTTMEARDLANQPLVRGKGGLLEELQPSLPKKGSGIREGWTRSSVILPGETETRDVLAKRVMMAETVDMPGAIYASQDAFKVELESGKKQYLHSVAQRQNATTELHITGMKDLDKILKAGGFQFEDIEGKLEKAGKSKFMVGNFPEGAKVTEGETYDLLREQVREGQDTVRLEDKLYRVEGTPEQPVFQPAEPILAKRRGYDVRAGKPTLYIPRYYNKKDPNLAFSNVADPGYETTEYIVKKLQEKHGDQINVVGYSSLGSGEKDSPAEAYINTPVGGILPLGIKGIGLKAYTAQLDREMRTKLAGIGKAVDIDFLTQEMKVPTRSLMSAFGVMNMRTQLAFLQDFLPGETPEQIERRKEAQGYVKEAYSNPTSRGVEINLEELASIAGKGNNREFSADVMFRDIFNKILDTPDNKQSARLFKKYGIGLPETQMMETAVYSETSKQTLENLKDQFPDLKEQIDFRDVTAPVEAGRPETSKQYRLRQKVMGNGASVVMTTGLSMVPEYTSASGYVNPKGIMALMQNYPEASKLMGLTAEFQVGGETREGFAGSLEAGAPTSADAGWFGLSSWLGFQKDLSQGITSIPAKSVPLGPKLASSLGYILQKAGQLTNTEEKLNMIKNEMGKLDPHEIPDWNPGIDITEAFLVDPNTGTLVPPINAVMNVESYEEGTKRGQTKTYIGDQYTRLLNAATQSSVSDPDMSYGIVHKSRAAFQTMVEKNFEHSKGKESFRPLYGVNLPGTRVGRYQGMTGLENEEAFASDDYIRQMLANNGFVGSEEVESVLNYLNTGADAYIPMLSQRFPDMSSKTEWLPTRLRSMKYLKEHGVDVPSGAAGGKGIMYFNPMNSRIQVGDQDADPAMSKLIPISDVDEQGNRTGIWKTTPAVQKEFDQALQIYNTNGGGADAALLAQFGERGINTGSRSLDSQRKNMYDYAQAVKHGKSSLRERIDAVGTVPFADMLKAAKVVKHHKGGMGAAYNLRTLTNDVAGAVLNREDTPIRQSSYESGALSYQLYLDQQPEVKNDLSAMERMFSSIGIYNIGEDDKGQAIYNVGFYMSNQEKSDLQFEEWQKKKQDANPGKPVKSDFTEPPLWRQGSADKGQMLYYMTKHLADMPPDRTTNSQLAWGFSTSDDAGQRIFDQLEKVKPEQRANVLSRMMGSGDVGFNSPYYLSAAYRMVDRLEKNDPQQLQNPQIKIPWITGQVLPIGEIAQTKEYRLMRNMEHSLIRGEEVIPAHQMEELVSLGGPRLGMLMAGYVRQWKTTTGGRVDVEKSEIEWQKALTNIKNTEPEFAVRTPPEVHASEIGALQQDVGAIEQGWTATKPEYMRTTAYQAALRWMSYPQIMGTKEYKGKTLFKQQEIEVPELEEYADWMQRNRGKTIQPGKAAEGGNIYEAAYVPEAKKQGLHHVGQTQSAEQNLRYSIAGMTVVGTPDFLGFDPTTNSMRIVDTKLSMNDPEGPGEASAKSKGRVKSYKHRIQQIAYAYGLEKMAKSDDIGAWLEQMGNFGYDTSDPKVREEVLNMRNAAAGGRFKIQLQPGNAQGGTLEAFDPIDIQYGQEEKAEYENLMNVIRERNFSPATASAIAKRTWEAIQSPEGIPSALKGVYGRVGGVPRMADFERLRNFANFVPGGTQRMSGGGELEKGDPKEEGMRRVRVGEGGPEELLIGKGKVKIVPTSELPEKKLAQGMNDPLAGYGIARNQGGDPAIPNQPERPVSGFDPRDDTDYPVTQTGAASPPQQPPPPPPAPPAGATASPQGDDYGELVKQLMAGIDAMTKSTATVQDTFLKAVQENFKVTVAVQLGGGAKAESDAMKPNITMGQGIASYKQLQSTVGGFEEAMRTELIKSFAEAGKTDVIRQNMPEAELQPSAGSLLGLAMENLQPQQYLPRLSRFMPHLKQVTKLTEDVEKIRPLLTGKDAGKLKAEYQGDNPIVQEMMEQTDSLSIADPLSFGNQAIEANVAAKRLAFMKTTDPQAAELLKQNKFEGINPELLKNLFGSLEKLADSTQRVTDTQGDLLKHTGALAEAEKARVSYNLDLAKVEQDALRLKAGPALISEEGRVRPTGDIMQALAEGRVSFPQVAATQEYIEQGAAIDKTEAKLAKAGKGPDLGGVSRRLFGGWGLMYMRSIAGLAMEPTMFGYQESLQEQTQAAMAMGGAFGTMPMPNNQEIASQRIAAQYGGGGYQALRTFQNDFMQRAPSAHNIGQGLIGGLATGGAAYWALGGLLEGTAAAGALGPLALGAGALAFGGAAAVNAYGAYQNVPQTSISAASRMINTGQALERPEIADWRVAVGGGAALGAATGAAVGAGFFGVGAIPGALVGGIAGAAAGAYKAGVFDPNRWAYYNNPEIKKQSDQLQNLSGMEKAGMSPQAIKDYLKGSGMNDAQVASTMAQYAQVKGNLEANKTIPIEGILGASSLQDRYNVTLQPEQYTNLATRIAQGVPVAQTASAMAGATGLPLAQQQAMMGQVLPSLINMPENQLQQYQLGAERQAALGPYAEFQPGATVPEIQQRYGQLAGMGNRGWGLLQQQYNIESNRAQMGLGFNAPNIQNYSGFIGDQDFARRQEQQQRDQYKVQAQQGLYSPLTQLGLPMPVQANAYQIPQIQQLQMQAQFGVGNAINLMQGGMGVQQAIQAGGAYTQMNPQQFQQYSGLQSGNPMQVASYALQNPTAWAQMPVTLPGLGGSEIPTAWMGMTDIREGQRTVGNGLSVPTQTMTGMQYGTSSLALPGVSSAQMATRIWGSNYQNRPELSQGLIGALVAGGTYGGQVFQLQEQARQQQAQSGIALQQIALSKAFQTGVGIDQYSGTVNPQTGSPFGFNTGKFGFNIGGMGSFQSQGGGMWGLEDAQRALGNFQQSYQFKTQATQLKTQDQFFWQDIGLNRTAQEAQRRYAQEDWRFQDQTRGLQRQWQVEDFQEQSRFLTGRDRRLAERQFGRETTMYGLEGEQIDKTRQRQKDAWNLEDERYKTQIEQHEVVLKQQQDQLAMARRVFEERKKLEEEQVKLSRAYWVEQTKLQEAAAGAAAAAAKKQAENALVMLELQHAMEEGGGAVKLFNEQSMAGLTQALIDVDPVFQKFIQNVKDLQKEMGAGGGGGSGSGSGTGGSRNAHNEGDAAGPNLVWHWTGSGWVKIKDRAFGGHVDGGEVFRGLEQGTPEFFKSDVSGTVIPLANNSNPWATEIFTPNDMAGNQPAPQHRVVINIGGQFFKEIILDTVNKEIDL